MKKYEQLEQQVKEIQKEIERLKKEEEKNKTQFPEYFSRTHAILFLEHFKEHNLTSAFTWDSTPQGYDYWEEIRNKLVDNVNYVNYQVPPEVIQQIQSWVIQSYREEYGV